MWENSGINGSPDGCNDDDSDGSNQLSDHENVAGEKSAICGQLQILSKLQEERTGQLSELESANRLLFEATLAG